MRYRLSTLLVAMVWVGLVCLALRSPSYFWSDGLFAGLVLMLLTSVLVAIYRTGRLRATAIGFVIFGLGYLAVEQTNYWPGGVANAGLPTQDLCEWLFVTLHGAFPVDPLGSEQDRQAYALYESRQNAFDAICLSVLATMVGLIGSIIAQVLYHTRPSDAPPSPSKRSA
jgi:hypothetical protein